MFHTLIERDDYTIPAIIEALKEERTESRQIKASMDFNRYASQISQIIDALETAMEVEAEKKKGGVK